MCFFIITETIITLSNDLIIYIKALMSGLNSNQIKKYEKYENDVKIYHEIEKNKNYNFINDIIMSYLLGEYRILYINEYCFLMLEEYFYECKSLFIKKLIKDNKKIIRIETEINDYVIIHFIMGYSFYFTIKELTLLTVDNEMTPNISYNSEYINYNVYDIIKRNKVKEFISLVHDFNLYEFYNLGKYVK